MEELKLQRHLAEIEEQGFTVVEHAIEPDLVEALHDALLRLESDRGIRPGANPFEGHHTIRIYNLLAHDRVFERVPVHGNVLPVVEGVLDAGCLVSSLSSISIDPGETAQPLHADDTLLNLPRPHPPLVCNSMWALTDFTAQNGATRVVPGSHRWSGQPAYGARYDSVPAEMAQGSVLIWRQPLARRRRQRKQRPARGHRHELLCRLHPPAGESAARHSHRTRCARRPAERNLQPHRAAPSRPGRAHPGILLLIAASGGVPAKRAETAVASELDLLRPARPVPSAGRLRAPAAVAESARVCSC